jgi:hypothetical protein
MYGSALAQILRLVVEVVVGLIVVLILYVWLVHPVVLFVTVKLAVYVPAVCPAGTGMLIGLEGRGARVTDAKLLLLHPVMLHKLGLPVVAVYASTAT